MMKIALMVLLGVMVYRVWRVDHKRHIIKAKTGLTDSQKTQDL
jgi:hypothetical protein